jgi:hypothetical protein
MRTVLVGTDFVYDKYGNLKPIEINTNLGIERYKPEENNEIFDITELSNFILRNNFTEVVYIGNLKFLNELIESFCVTNNIEYLLHKTSPDSIMVPDVEDNDTTLIIRSSYDSTAIVDDTYCKDKVNFLELIKGTLSGSEFAFLNENGELINNIISVTDNGNHPNFILKSRLPHYDKEFYPRLFKVTTQDELNVVLELLDQNNFLMEFHINVDKTFNGNLKIIRSMNLLFPPNLESIPIGQFTKLVERAVDNDSIFNSDTFELAPDDRLKYITADGWFKQPKLLDTDLVELADGTFITAKELQVNDFLKTIDVPNINNVNERDSYANYNIDYETFVSGVTYSENRVLSKKRVTKYTEMVKIIFTDGTEWSDTSSSSYLVIKNNVVRYVRLWVDPNVNITPYLQAGDKIILLDTSSETTITPIIKEVSGVELYKDTFSGWIISVENVHSFLTKSNSVNETNTSYVSVNTSYVSIEHNYGYCYYAPVSCYFTPGFCGKGVCCGYQATCQNSCGYCYVPV